MQLLSRHPEIVVVAGGQPFEVMAATYLASALHTLTSPADWKTSLHPDGLADFGNQIGYDPYYHLDFGGGFSNLSTLDLFQQGYVAPILRRRFSTILKMQYSLIAREQNKDKVRYFAEKFRFNRDQRAAINRMFSGYKEIFLVRDIRDVYCSFHDYLGSGARICSRPSRELLPPQ